MKWSVVLGTRHRRVFICLTFSETCAAHSVLFYIININNYSAVSAYNGILNSDSCCAKTPVSWAAAMRKTWNRGGSGGELPFLCCWLRRRCQWRSRPMGRVKPWTLMTKGGCFSRIRRFRKPTVPLRISQTSSEKVNIRNTDLIFLSYKLWAIDYVTFFIICCYHRSFYQMPFTTHFSWLNVIIYFLGRLGVILGKTKSMQANKHHIVYYQNSLQSCSV